MAWLKTVRSHDGKEGQGAGGDTGKQRARPEAEERKIQREAK